LAVLDQPKKKGPVMTDQEIINQAIAILESRLQTPEHFVTCPSDTRAYLKLHLAELEHESFQVMLLNSKHGVLGLEELSKGTIDQAPVYPREVVKLALKFNAAAVIFAHNHPSGNEEPSMADEHLTQSLVEALKLINVRVLDHFVVGNGVYSFAENGLLLSPVV
jgi:DNA repair protein RadC